MKKTFFPLAAIVILAIIAMTASAFANDNNDITANSTPTAVTVYRSKALIHRSATVNLPQGNSTVVFPSMTEDIDDGSVRITGSGSADVSILEVKVEREYLDKASGKEIEKLQASLDSLNDEMRKLSDRVNVVSSQKEFVLSLKDHQAMATAQTLGTQKINVKDFEDLLSFVEKSLTGYNEELHSIETKKIKLQDKINAANQRLNDLRSQQNKTKKRIVVRIDVAKAGSMTFDCSYIVSQASWQPLYDARADADKKKLNLTYYGLVKQSTGENWDNVQLTLSTAQPTRGNYIPQLSAWYVHPMETRGLGETNGGYSMRQGIMEDKAKSSGEVAIPDNALFPNPRPSAIQQYELSANFTVTDPISIPSDGAEHKATVAVANLDANMEYVAVPKLSTAAFLRAKALNSTGAPLLPGKVNVFLDNQFVATTSMPTVVTGDSIELAVGTNDAIQVEHKLVNKLQEYNGLISKTYKWNYEYVTTITNKSGADINISIMDEVPVSQNEKIIVETQKIDPATDHNDQGIYTWQLHLQPGEKKEIHTKYSIEYPRDMKVTGLE
jgi:uncharacterized protein (TIGR02231 family)